MPLSLPAIRYLLAIGFLHVRQPGRYGWLYAANATLNLLDMAVPGRPATLLIGFASIVMVLLATRQILTGSVTFRPRDILASLRLIWLVLLAILPLVAVYAATTLIGSIGGLAAPLSILALIALFVLFLRTGFLMPALAVGDATGIRVSFAQTRVVWPLVLALAVVVAIVGSLLDLAVAAPGFPGIPRTVLAALVGTATFLFAQAPICWLYARITGRDASAVAP